MRAIAFTQPFIGHFGLINMVLPRVNPKHARRCFRPLDNRRCARESIGILTVAGTLTIEGVSVAIGRFPVALKCGRQPTSYIKASTDSIDGKATTGIPKNW